MYSLKSSLCCRVTPRVWTSFAFDIFSIMDRRPYPGQESSLQGVATTRQSICRMKSSIYSSTSLAASGLMETMWHILSPLQAEYTGTLLHANHLIGEPFCGILFRMGVNFPCRYYRYYHFPFTLHHVTLRTFRTPLHVALR